MGQNNSILEDTSKIKRSCHTNDGDSFELCLIVKEDSDQIADVLHCNFNDEPKWRNSSWWASKIKNGSIGGIVLKKFTKVAAAPTPPDDLVRLEPSIIGGIFWKIFSLNEGPKKSTTVRPFTREDVMKYQNHQFLSLNSYDILRLNVNIINDPKTDNIENVTFDKISDNHGQTKILLKYNNKLNNKDHITNHFNNKLQLNSKTVHDKMIHITDCCVDSEYRKQGIAGLLIQSLFQIYPKHTIIGLEVRKDNQNAINLYWKHGFEHINSSDNYYGKGIHAMKMITILQK